jgi:hypothetical protein
MFANEAPGLAGKVINDSAARKQLETRLRKIQKDISAFNEFTPPDITKEVYQQIVGYNEKLNELIDTTMKKEKWM